MDINSIHRNECYKEFEKQNEKLNKNCRQIYWVKICLKISTSILSSRSSNSVHIPPGSAKVAVSITK